MTLQSSLTLTIEIVFLGFFGGMIFDFFSRIVLDLRKIAVIENLQEAPVTDESVEIVNEIADPWLTETEYYRSKRKYRSAGIIFQLCLPPAPAQLPALAEPPVTQSPKSKETADFNQMKLSQLKAECKKRGIVPEGNKARIQTWLDALRAAV